jgi:hypothetical protein
VFFVAKMFACACLVMTLATLCYEGCFSQWMTGQALVT